MKQHELTANQVTAGYDKQIIFQDLSITIPANKISIIIGSNGSGKSTLLKTIARLIKPSKGDIYLDGKKASAYPAKEFAKLLGLMPQSPIVPEGISVADLIARGRYPHRSMMQSMNQADYTAIASAMELMQIQDLAHRYVDELSGGQRQRVWIALALAQDSDILFLDEPTTFLDIAYQIEILDMLMELNRKKGTTIVMVMHDINLSARYADYMFAMANGALIAEGTPVEVIQEELMHQIYGIDSKILTDTIAGSPMMVPMGRFHHQTAQQQSR